jgi:hypothetical protein
VHARAAADGVSNVVEKESHARRYDTETPLAWKQNPADVIAVARCGSELARITTEIAPAEAIVSESNPIRVFVTHAFQETDDYLRVFEFLESVDRFFYLNVSKPDNVPTTGGIEAIKDELITQIKEAEAVIVLPSLYEEKESLARFLMDAADVNSKPMIAIRPFGGLLETPPAVVERVREHIEWNDREIADALRRQARGEDTARWETIDFPGWDEHGEIEDNT